MHNYTEEIRKISPFVNLLGLTVEKIEKGYCRSSVDIKKDFLNKRKIVHGGVIYSMADISMGLAVYSQLQPDEETTTAEIKINYLRPAAVKSLCCEARLLSKGKTLAVLEAEVKDADRLIAVQ